MRKLASIQKIVDIQPIPNADKIQVATVLGWHCVVAKKDNFQIGDKVVYFEVDSILPEREEFEFLRDKKFRIKTIKLRGQISQGLVMPLSILPKGKYSEDQDVTEILGVKKYDPEAEVENRLNNEKENLKQSRIQRYMNRFSWWRKFFPKKSYKFPEFISKTDETRIQAMPQVLSQYGSVPMLVTEKVDGCFEGQTRIMTNVGEVEISKIFKDKNKYEIATYNIKREEIEYNKILDVHKINVSDKNIYKIGFGRKGKGNREKYSYCTENHEWFSNGSWVRADSLNVGDEICHFSSTVKSEIKEILLGCLLGDSSLNSNYSDKMNYWAVNFNHSIKQEKYFNYKKELLGSLFIEQKDKISGFGSRMKIGTTKSNLDITQYLEGLFPDHKKIITEKVCDNITPISLAFWFMDDGSLSHQKEEKQKPKAVLNTQGFSFNEVKLLANCLRKKFNLVCEIGDSRVYKGHILIFNKENTQRLCSLISPYVCESMRYKLPKYYSTFNCHFENKTFDVEDNILKTKIISIRKISNSECSNTFYDLTIENNHNYFANGILVHNCSITAFLLKRKYLLWDKFEFGVCSRNLQLKEDNSNWWNCARKYNIEKVLKQLFFELDCQDFIAIQGEIVGTGIQGNKYDLDEQVLFVFNLITDVNKWDTLQIRDILAPHFIDTVPIIEDVFFLNEFTLDQLVNYANGSSILANTLREGVVVRDYDNTISFKVISPEFLLKHNL